jgi:hypothetical protein
MSNNKLVTLAERLIECSRFVSQDELVDSLIIFLDEKKEEHGESDSIADKIRLHIEKFYELPPNALNNSFNVKDRHLTEPKFMWVMISLHIFKGDRKQVKKFIENGITSQKIYTCNKQFQNLEDIYTEKEAERLRETYKNIIETYE